MRAERGVELTCSFQCVKHDVICGSPMAWMAIASPPEAAVLAIS